MRMPSSGGTCLRVGCIPSKALLESSELYHATRHDYAEHGVEVGEVNLDLPTMLQRKDKIVAMLTRSIDALFKKNDITRYHAHGRFDGPGRVKLQGLEGSPPDLPESLEAGKVLIATGSKVASLRGIEFDGDRIATSTEALAYPQVPESLVVIGAGYIGLELGSVWSRLGFEGHRGRIPRPDPARDGQRDRCRSSEGFQQAGDRVQTRRPRDRCEIQRPAVHSPV